MACSTTEQNRKKAVRSTLRATQVTGEQKSTNLCIGANHEARPICTVVNSLSSLPITSVPAVQSQNPSNNSQLLSTPNLIPTIKFAELEDNLKEFAKGLHESELNFHEMVANVNSTDSLVFQNASNLECLHRYLIELEKSSKSVDTDLTMMFSELNVLEETVRNLERHLEGEIAHHSKCPDGKRREILYHFITQFDSNINHLLRQLTEVICMNNSPHFDDCHQTNPIQQIECILNHHFETLEHFEKAIQEIRVQMDRIITLHKETQRKCSM